MSYVKHDSNIAPPASLLARRPWLGSGAGGLGADGVAFARIAASVGTPVYCYIEAELRGRVGRLREAFARHGVTPFVAYPVKANDTQSVIALLRSAGCGADTVSGGEIVRALTAGIVPGDIVFSGVGKTAAELASALKVGIRQVNVESREEFELLVNIARGTGLRASVCLRLNPDIDGGTLPQITTGTRTSKFGMDAGELLGIASETATLPFVTLAGVSMHIGSQIHDVGAFRRAFARLEKVVIALRAMGFTKLSADIGGGLAIPYGVEAEFDLDSYAAAGAEMAHRLDVDLVVEPGRWIVGPAGVLLCSVIRTKTQAGRQLIVVDAGMNDLLRPAIYGAWHGIVPVGGDRCNETTSLAEVVGPICESSDSFGSHWLPALEPGDLLAVLDAGAYGATMSSFYNTRVPPAAVMVGSGGWALARRRFCIEELIARDVPGVQIRDPSAPRQWEVF